MVPFALNPGTINNEVIDYSTSEGLKIFNQSTQSLEQKYDGDPLQFSYFIAQVLTREETYGWNDILKIDVDGKSKHLINDYGQYTIQNIRETSKKWHGESSHNRNTQNAHQMYIFLDSSITQNLSVKIHNARIETKV